VKLRGRDFTKFSPNLGWRAAINIGRVLIFESKRELAQNQLGHNLRQTISVRMDRDEAHLEASGYMSPILLFYQHLKTEACIFHGYPPGTPVPRSRMQLGDQPQQKENKELLINTCHSCGQKGFKTS
jgi:hypothetical protein